VPFRLILKIFKIMKPHHFWVFVMTLAKELLAATDPLRMAAITLRGMEI